jgi:prepilin peptidase CpaA
MAIDLTTLPSAPPAAADDSLGIDRAFVLSMARVPVLAAVWVAAAWGVHQLFQQFAPTEYSNLGPLAVLCFGMVLAAVIDGWAFKVPNWLTLSLVVSGWYLGLLHDCGVAVDAGQGGIGSALLGTAWGFALLFPMLFIQGMGQGDVKMQMGFGSWVGAYFGFGAGFGVILGAFCLGAIIGGVFGLVMMFTRRQFGTNKGNFAAILGDLQTMLTDGPTKAAERANSRRKSWVRLPYGVPLCAGFLGFLWYKLVLA